MLAKETNTLLETSNHSRGTMTEKISLAYLQNVLDITGIPIVSTKICRAGSICTGLHQTAGKKRLCG